MIRYIDLTKFGRQYDPFYFALESVSLELLDKLNEDICFLWNVHPAVIIGKNQLLENEINLDALETYGVDVFRRPSGGGAVFSDPGCIKYSFISNSMTKDEMYVKSLTLIKDFLETFGIKAEFTGRNDLTVDGYKFSGNAYYQTKLGKALHGTILYDTDMTVLSKVLNPSKEKLQSKGVTSVRSRVTNLKDFVGLDLEDFRGQLHTYLNKNTYLLTSKEEVKVEKYRKPFETKEWIYGNNPPYDMKRKKKYPYGEIEIHLSIKNNKIKDIKFYGDFFSMATNLTILINELKGLKLDESLLDRLNKMDISAFIEGMNSLELYNLIRGEENE